MSWSALDCVICGAVFPAFGSDKPACERAASAFRQHACAFNRRVEGVDLDPQLVQAGVTTRPRIQSHPAGGAS